MFTRLGFNLCMQDLSMINDKYSFSAEHVDWGYQRQKPSSRILVKNASNDDGQRYPARKLEKKSVGSLVLCPNNNTRIKLMMFDLIEQEQ